MQHHDDAALDRFHPLVRQWFVDTFGAASPPQRAGWPAIAAGQHTLILAPTGSGKTLAAFLYQLDALIREGQEEPLGNAVHLLYVSPLKALGNDVQRNLELPLQQLRARFAAAGESFPEIRVAVRTGDTPAAARTRMLRRTPHILITTPESLHILLTSVRGRTMFSALRTVIVDEIHAIAGSKRGAHLALTLERLHQVAGAAPQRVGLSATQRPLDEVARFLGGCEPGSGDTPSFRPVTVVDCGLVKETAVQVISPVEDLAHVDGSIWMSVVPLVLEQVRASRTTLVFVNNRGQAERIAARVNALAQEEIALPYHGSLSRERRLLLESRLKAGELRALVTTSSLELGIDVGSVDLVMQLQSPKRVAAALQRVGRAGHTLSAVSRGVFVPTFRDDAMEQMAIARAMKAGDVEPTCVVQNPLDVLAQMLVAMIASDTPAWTADALGSFVRQAYPYHRLTRRAFEETLAMLSGSYPSDVAAELDARVHWNRADDTLTPTRSARMVATISGGTIPDRGLYAVMLADKTRLGELDEEFVHESRVGDAFQLGSSTWRIHAIEHDRVVVVPAPGAPARMPFWHGEFMARSSHLTPIVGELRRSLAASTDDASRAKLEAEYFADSATVTSLVEYVRTQRELTGRVPDDRQIVVEYFRDEVGSVRIVMHAPFGGRVTAPWGMALARRIRERLQVDAQVQTTDDGLMLRLPPLSGDPPLDVLRTLTSDDAQQLVIDEVGASSLFGARFRMNAARALLLPRGNPRRRMPLWLQRLKSADLLQSVRRYQSFPILVETYRDVLQDAFDLTELRRVLDAVQRGEIAWHVAPTVIPSPFAQSLQFGFVIDWMYGDDAPRAEQRATMLSLDRALLDELLGGEGADAATLAVLDEVLAERRGTATGRRARDADELAVLVDRAGDVDQAQLRQRVADQSEWSRGDPVDELLKAHRLIAISINQELRFILVDSLPRYRAAFPASIDSVMWGRDLVLKPVAELPPAWRDTELDQDSAREEILTRWVALAGPFSVDEVTERYGLDSDWTAARLAAWESDGRLVRGSFGSTTTTPRWCTRRTLERARRRELARVRAQIKPVSIDAFGEFMTRWQHLAPGTRLRGPDAAAVALDQLLGISRPGVAWERDYLPARIADYQPAMLDQLVLQGSVVWAMTPTGDGRNASLRFFERGTGRLWLTPLDSSRELSPQAQQVLDALRSQGASFIDDLAASTALSTHRLRDALHELAFAGMISNDTIAGLRDLLRWTPVFPQAAADAPDPTRWLPDSFVVQRRVNVRRLAKWKRPDRPDAPTWPGRWSLVHAAAVMGPERDELAMAELVARHWLERYGIVSRDWWRRERPAVSWRFIYHELKRMEFRGEVQRGYFVEDLAGAQFARPDAIDMLRGNANDAPVVMAASDPANVWSLPQVRSSRMPRGSGALLVQLRGRIALTVASGGRRWEIDDTIGQADLQSVLAELVQYLRSRGATGKRRDTIVETINGVAATSSPWADALANLGFRREPAGLRWNAGFV